MSDNTDARTKRFPATYIRKLDNNSESIGDFSHASRTPKTLVLKPKVPKPSSTAAVATNNTVPTGVGLDSAAVRARMVQRLRLALMAPEAVLAAIEAVPRHEFVDAGLVAQAYEDTALPIGHGQTISKPSSVARLLTAAGLHERPRKQARVLDIGTGCGYQAAVLAQLCREVVSIERFRDLHEKARANLRKIGVLGIHGVRLVHADAGHIAPVYGQFDAIVSAASAASLGQVPSSWIERLAVGGVLVAPVGMMEQKLLRVVKRSEDTQDVEVSLLEAVKFVPLQSGKL